MYQSKKNKDSIPIVKVMASFVKLSNGETTSITNQVRLPSNKSITSPKIASNPKKTSKGNKLMRRVLFAQKLRSKTVKSNPYQARSLSKSKLLKITSNNGRSFQLKHLQSSPNRRSNLRLHRLLSNHPKKLKTKVSEEGSNSQYMNRTKNSNDPNINHVFCPFVSKVHQKDCFEEAELFLLNKPDLKHLIQDKLYSNKEQAFLYQNLMKNNEENKLKQFHKKISRIDKIQKRSNLLTSIRAVDPTTHKEYFTKLSSKKQKFMQKVGKINSSSNSQNVQLQINKINTLQEIISSDFPETVIIPPKNYSVSNKNKEKEKENKVNISAKFDRQKALFNIQNYKNKINQVVQKKCFVNFIPKLTRICTLIMRPPSRENSSLIFIPYSIKQKEDEGIEGHLLCYGGNGAEHFSDMFRLGLPMQIPHYSASDNVKRVKKLRKGKGKSDKKGKKVKSQEEKVEKELKKQNNDVKRSLNWTKHLLTTSVDIFGQVAISCHSLNFYKGKLIVFGGWNIPLQVLRPYKRLSNTLFFINPFQMSIEKPSNQYVGRDRPCPRKHHSSCVIDDNLVIFGGMDPSNKILEDIYYYNLTQHSWSKIKDIGCPEDQNYDELDFFYGMARHKVMYCQNSMEYGMYKNKCLSFFGQNCDLEPISTFFKLEIDFEKKKVIVEEARAINKPPPARHSHQVVLLPKCSFFLLILDDAFAIHGGKGLNQRIFNDLYLFICLSNIWVKVRFQNGSRLPPRTNHSVRGSYFNGIDVWGWP